MQIFLTPWKSMPRPWHELLRGGLQPSHPTGFKSIDLWHCVCWKKALERSGVRSTTFLPMSKPVGVSGGWSVAETTGGSVTKADSGRGSSPTLSFSSIDGPPGYFETWSDERTSRLSKTERLVLAEILNCLADKEIAQKLGKSLRVVKSHNSSIYRKTGLQGRIQIFRWYGELLRTRLSK